ncbi:50S ribosomal protein L2 [Patescibacteria group bacterium]|nr:50S ribosomal protein L2 [Patescibacteria group bacterium]MBU1682900.1 50S ribosomal protein L2 [Patescibacteria group bacterium]MBU1934640.1 50S ribosomal protein L2 [Patescibacteria group bacterium]
MPVKKYNPTTPGRRGMSVVDYSELSSKKPKKSLLKPKAKKAGRNNQGRITVRHRGGGVKRLYRVIDGKRFDKLNIPAKVESIEYDPNRTAFIALLLYKDGERRYILAPEKLKAGDHVICSEKAKVKAGNRMQIRNIPVGFGIHDLEVQVGKGAQMIRSAGSSGKVTSLDSELAQVTLPSGSVRYVSKDCYATIGIVSNIDHSNVIIGKAGRKRLMGRRPQVLGKSMNACDHPHGGGEGHTAIGPKTPKTPWGMPALGVKTRRLRYTDHLIIKGRRKKKR